MRSDSMLPVSKSNSAVIAGKGIVFFDIASVLRLQTMSAGKTFRGVAKPCRNLNLACIMNEAASNNPIVDGNEIERGANYLYMRNTLNIWACCTVFFGILAFVCGLGFMVSNADVGGHLVVLTSLGGLLVLVGLMVIIRPSSRGYIAMGVTLILVGIWNVFNAMTSKTGITMSSELWGLFGFLQIFWGGVSFGKYRRLARISVPELSEESLARAKQFVTEVGKATGDSDPTLLEFRTEGNFPTSSGDTWKARLIGSDLMFVAYGSGEVIRAAKADVVIRNKGKVLFEKKLKADLNLRGRKFQGFIYPDMFERYEKWKLRE